MSTSDRREVHERPEVDPGPGYHTPAGVEEDVVGLPDHVVEAGALVEIYAYKTHNAYISAVLSAALGVLVRDPETHTRVFDALDASADRPIPHTDLNRMADAVLGALFPEER